MKTLICYTSVTGNTERIARAIFDGIDGGSDIRRINDVISADDYDVVFIGFPIYNFEPCKTALDFIKRIKPGTAVAFFMTMSLTAAPDFPGKQQLFDLTLSNCNSIAVHTRLIGIFDCPGELSAETADALINSNNPALQGFGKMRGYTLGYPNHENMNAAKEFAKDIIKKVTPNHSYNQECTKFRQQEAQIK